MRTVISTGAGISKASGLPVYRGDDGTWTNHPALERMSTAKQVEKNIDVLWEYWGPFRQLVLDVEPNEAHMAIARAQVRQMRRGGRFTIVTQNVDELHQSALENLFETKEITEHELMLASANVAQLHGSIFEERCLASTLGGKGCENKLTWASTEARNTPGECPVCNGPSRPAVVLFGENVLQSAWRQAEAACLGTNIYIACGTSGIVYPAVELVSVAKSMGAKTILVNKDEWDFPHPDFDETILGNSEEILPGVLDTYLRD